MTPLRWRVLLVLGASAAVGVGVFLVARGPDRPQTIEERVVEVASGLRCPVCQSLSVADSESQLAHEMRRTIESLLREGRTADEIRGYFVDRFGEWILLSPPARGLGLLPWLLPVAALAVGLIGFFGLFRRGRGRPAPEVSATDRARVADALAGFEEPE